MGDPFSVAAGVVGVVGLALQLFAGCIQGFVLLSTARNLGRDAARLVCMLELQEASLTDWARCAGLLAADGQLDARLNAPRIVEALRQLQDLLADRERLQKRYGLRITSSPGPSAPKATELAGAERVCTGVTDETRRRILRQAQVAHPNTLFKQLWWAAVDKDKLAGLVTDVDGLVRSLWQLLSPHQHEELMGLGRGIRADIVKLNTTVSQLMSLHAAVVSTQTIVPDPVSASLRPLAVAAEIKALSLALSDVKQRPPAGQTSEAGNRRGRRRNLEPLSRLALTGFTPMKKHEDMGIARYQETTVFVEWKVLNPARRSKILPRAENLAALLSVPKDDAFRTLRCNGLIDYDGKIAFVFEHPAPASPAPPRSLVDLFSAKAGISSPSLSTRLRIAVQLARAVQSLHRAGWLHKNIRSENILFFPNHPSAAATEHPVLGGFSFARQDSPAEISEQPSADPKSDIYRHPEAMGEPSTSFSATMDVYSLGTVLLEIAEWRPLRYLVESHVDVGAEDIPLNQLAGVRNFLLEGAGKGGTASLRTRAGDIYADVCLMCLRGTIDEGKPEKEDWAELEPTLIDEAVRTLDACKI